jgi:hypothetical protein
MPCTAGQGLTLQGLIEVSGPADVTYHWLVTDASGSRPIAGTPLHFSGTGRQAAKVQYTLPVDQYQAGTANNVEVSLLVDSPVSVTASPAQVSYLIDCLAASASPSPSPSGAAYARQLAARQPARQSARAFPPVDGYQVHPILRYHDSSFEIGVTASRQIGPAELTWTVTGGLGYFHSSGAVHIADHHLQSGSGLQTTELAGWLKLTWKLSAAVPQALRNLVSPRCIWRACIVMGCRQPGGLCVYSS